MDKPFVDFVRQHVDIKVFFNMNSIEPCSVDGTNIFSKTLAGSAISNTSQVKRRASHKILLVEDVPVIQKIHQCLLNKLGYELDIASDGIEALRMFDDKYNMIFMDI